MDATVHPTTCARVKGVETKEKMQCGGQEMPPFLPKPEDSVPAPEGGTMGPVGPWATGRVDWGPLSGLTGTRPVVDHYSITRYSDGEWRKHNEEVLCSSADDLHRVNMAEYNSRRSLECISGMADKAQDNTTIRLQERAHDLHRWKIEVERITQAMSEEIKALEVQRRRAGQARSVLGLCRSICGECLRRRGFRDGYDLCRDPVEEELVKEASLIEEVGQLLNTTLKRIEEQLDRNKSIKGRLEDNWSDKSESFALAMKNSSLRNDSPQIMFKPASTRFPDNQSSPAGWESAARELLATGEAVRGQSCELRALLEGPILQDAMRDLKHQAEKVDIELARGISDLQQCIAAMHAELDVVVRRNAESETLIVDLEQGLRGLDRAMKVAQTRLDLLQLRPRGENCRDKAQFSLVDEVKSISEQSTTLKGQLQEAESALLNLIHSRGILEKELQNKLKTLDIDRNRCQAMRAQYPTASAMSGF